MTIGGGGGDGGQIFCGGGGGQFDTCIGGGGGEPKACRIKIIGSKMEGFRASMIGQLYAHNLYMFCFCDGF